MKTILKITIEHAKPLPEKLNLTDTVASRTYGYLTAHGQQIELTVAKLTSDEAVEVETAMLKGA